LIKEVDHYLEEGEKLLKKADSLLGQDDRFRVKLEKIVRYTECNVEELRKFVKEKRTLMY
jgi:hypothetical protein